MRIKTLESLKSRTVVSNESTCGEWQGARQKQGYGHVWHDGRIVSTHRLAYALAVAPIPEGMTVDHLCFNPPCVNPDHLRLLSRRDNQKNQRSAQATHCKEGHEFTKENTYIRPTGRRQCRACNASAARRLYERKRRAA